MASLRYANTALAATRTLLSWVRAAAAGLSRSAMTVPAWIMVVGIIALPVLVGVYLSFRNETLASTLPSHFVGLDNYQTDVLSPNFVQSLWITVLIVGIGSALQLPAGLLLAVVLAGGLRGSRVFRSALLMPMLLTPVAVSLMWRFMFNADLGVIDWLIRQLGQPGVNWLGDPIGALIAIIVVDSWQSIPFVMLFSLAGIGGLPQDPYDASRVDGASAWQQFRFLTFPMLLPVLLITLMIRVVEGFKMFDIVYVVTAGGPGTATQNLSLLAYRTGFTFLATSRGAAVGVALAILLLPAYILWVRAVRR